MSKKRLVVLTGAGMSAESGIPTFRGGDGLWENHRIEDVASPEGWRKDRALVLDFYNQRRKRIYEVEPNRGHFIPTEDISFSQNLKGILMYTSSRRTLTTCMNVLAVQMCCIFMEKL